MRRPAPPRPLPSRLLFVADASHAAGGLPRLVAGAVRAGVELVELRRVAPSGGAPETGARLAEARACLRAARGATLLVNDRADVAVASGAHGLHVGQQDLPVADARRLVGPSALLGLSTHSPEQVHAARDLPVSYVALGPIFASPTKSGHAEPLGLSTLESCVRDSSHPIVAIGGITPSRAAAVLSAGAACVAVASAIAVGDVASNVAAFRRVIDARP